MNSRTLLDQLLNSGRQLASRGREMADQRLPPAGPERDSMLSGLGKGALAGGLLTMLLGSRSGRRLGGSAIKIGGLALLGKFAYDVYKKWSANKPNTAAADDPGTPVGELPGPAADQRSLSILRAMVAAAKADGHIDAEERAKIREQVQRFGLDDATLAALQAELDKPLDPADIAAGADSVEAAAEIYLASLLVIDVDNPMERAYLRELAGALKLSDDLVTQIESELRPA